MKWLAPLPLLCACGFYSSPASVDAADVPKDGRPIVVDVATIDAPPDTPAPPCRIALPDPVGTNRGRAGDNNGGGDSDTPPTCASANDRIVGFQIDLSNQNTTFGGRSALAVAIACAPVTIAADGTGTTGTVTTDRDAGLGQMGWAPATASTLTTCQPGWVMYGLNVHTGGGGNGRFLDLEVRCAKLGTTGAPTADTEALPITGSGDEANGSDTVDCNANEILARFTVRKGQGIDSVDLHCAPSDCE